MNQYLNRSPSPKKKNVIRTENRNEVESSPVRGSSKKNKLPGGKSKREKVIRELPAKPEKPVLDSSESRILLSQILEGDVLTVSKEI